MKKTGNLFANLIQGFIVEMENLQKNFQKELKEENAKHEQKIRN